MFFPVPNHWGRDSSFIVLDWSYMNQLLRDSVMQRIQKRRYPLESQLVFGQDSWAYGENTIYNVFSTARLSSTKEISGMSGTNLLVYNVIYWANNFDSFYQRVPTRCQCRAGANRSVVDIYRHIPKRYNVTLFDVMSALADMAYAGDIATMKCNDIRKRVFFLGGYLEDDFRIDELGLSLPDWRDI